MKTEMAMLEESLHFCRFEGKAPVYYDNKEDRILVVEKSRVYFQPDMLWKLVKEVGGKRRTVSSVTEIRELMNQSGYEYLGEV